MAAGWTFALLFQAMVTTTPTLTYAEAYQKSVETGKPLVIVVGTDWCPACIDLKRSTMTSLQREGAMKDVIYATVDKDKHGALASKLMRGGTIPQMIIYHRDDEGWHKQHMVGLVSENMARSAINTAKQLSDKRVHLLRPPLEQQ